MPEKNLLVTGPPGCGKTTLVRNIARAIPQVRKAGFITTEIREAGERSGFSLISCDGRRGVLSHVRFPGPPRVGRYGVDLPGFEAFLEEIPFDAPGTRLVLVDEIGKMECFSPLFRRRVTRCLDGPVPLLATIALRGDRFIEKIKQRPDVILVMVTRKSRDRLTREIGERLQAMERDAEDRPAEDG
jgi:nucleoside-triphosphatase